MRKITAGQILTFFCCFVLALVLALLSTRAITSGGWLGEFYGVVFVLLLVTTLYGYAMLVYRLFLALAPLQVGYLEPGSRAEFVAQVNALFYLLLFNSLVRTEFLPIPLKTLIYAGLGAKIGHNSYSPGTLLDPPLTRIGDNSIVGHGATLYAHAIEGHHFSLEPITLGNNVTIGAHAIVMPGVEIGDDAIVSSGAVVPKGTRIGPGERWGGIPARRLDTA